MTTKPPVVSTGRGGAGNIGHDPTVYADGGIVREGAVGEESHGHEYSTGRGGAGNVGTPKLGPTTARRGSQDIIPETALRPAHENENYHTGRGGGGNIHRDPNSPRHKHHDHEAEKKESLVDKAKHLFHLDKSDSKSDKSPNLTPVDK